MVYSKFQLKNDIYLYFNYYFFTHFAIRTKLKIDKQRVKKKLHRNTIMRNWVGP